MRLRFVSFWMMFAAALWLATGLSINAFNDGADEPPAPGEPADRVINIVAERFSFTPSVIKLKQGEVVELRIRSLDTNHGFLIPEANVNVIVPKRGAGDARILFRAQREGEFEFLCSKPCGAGHMMMRGRIVVEGT